ncbi:hypothetical protein [Roseisalinus antarcticus]|uniref:hypothetical protein n=1 Tax=Roseisalinus antarcticus TaxID=254357 RepID=UPI00279636B2|nr:hypothetical protein [Roseisalinus antarcticus]
MRLRGNMESALAQVAVTVQALAEIAAGVRLSGREGVSVTAASLSVDGQVLSALGEIVLTARDDLGTGSVANLALGAAALVQVRGGTGRSVLRTEAGASVLMADGSRVETAEGDIVIEGAGDVIVSDLSSGGQVRVTSTGGAILDADTNGGRDIQAARIELSAAGTIGAAANPLEIDLAADAPLSTTGGMGVHLTELSGPLRIGSVTAAQGDISLAVVDAAGVQDTILLAEGGVVEATAGNLTLTAGDGLILEAGSRLTAQGRATLSADRDATDADPGVGAQVRLAGQILGASIVLRTGGDADTVVLDRPMLGGPMEVYTGAGADSVEVTRRAGAGTEMLIDGEDGGDTLRVTMAQGAGASLTRVRDSGGTGTDQLVVTGLDDAEGDRFLLRGAGAGGPAFVAALLDDGAVARVTHGAGIDALLVDTRGGNDEVVLDGTGVATRILLGEGADLARVGQVFQTPRDSAGFATTRTVRGLLSNGAEVATEIDGGEGDDRFELRHNTARLTLRGGIGNDTFALDTFETEAGPLLNGLVRIEAGTGDDRATLFGSAGADAFLVDGGTVTGAGRTVEATGLATLVLDAAEGDDRIYIDKTGDGIDALTVFGGLGSDRIDVGGDHADVIGASGATLSGTGRHDTQSLAASVHVLGGGGVGSLRTQPGAVTLPGETDALVPDGVVLGFDADLSAIFQQAEVDPDDLGDAVARLGLGGVAELAGQTFTVVEGDGTGLAWRIDEARPDGTLVLEVPQGRTGEAGVGSLFHIGPAAPALYADEAMSRDRLSIFDDMATASRSGRMAEGAGGTAVFGLGLGAGGLNFTEMEAVELLLGAGDDSFDVETTQRGALTAIHGGAGNDTITATGRQGDDLRTTRGGASVTAPGALVLFGDTTADGGPYAGGPAVAPGLARSGVQAGDDVVSADGMALSVVIFGGGGADVLTGGQAGDRILGGSGDDSLSGGAGADILQGDGGLNLDLAAGRAKIAVTASEIAGDAGDAPGTAGNDVLIGGTGQDILSGDFATVTQAPGQDLLAGTSGVVAITSIRLGAGGDDDLRGGAQADILIGGAGNDALGGGSGTDALVGDGASVELSGGLPVTIQSLDGPADGDDDMDGDLGDSFQIGGGGNDILRGASGTGAAVLLGDGGAIRIIGDRIEAGSADTPVAGTDLLVSGGGRDILIGGGGGDTAEAGGGADIVLGDDGRVVVEAGRPVTVEALRPATGGADSILGGAGDDLLLGGAGRDAIDAGAGRDLVTGDSASLTGTAETSPRFRTLVDGEIYDAALAPGAAGEVKVAAGARPDPSWSGTGAPVWAALLATGAGGSGITFHDAGGRADRIAGGAGDDMIFGQSGGDSIEGDGALTGTPVDAAHTADGTLTVQPSTEAATDGDDYIEGNGGSDVIFGNLGQDDIVGGSSSMFGRDTAARRPDGADLIFGGAGLRIARNDLGDSSLLAPGAALTDANPGGPLHAADADVILGDNGNIYRLVDGVTGAALTLGHDSYTSPDGPKIAARATELLDYTAGGTDADPAAQDTGAGDEIHGEGGDDILLGMAGSDVLFGGAQDDDLIGGWGNDWISGGSGIDGVLGDDGRIFTSRKTEGAPFQAGAAAAADVEGPEAAAGAEIYPVGALVKTVTLTPIPTGVVPDFADDLVFGGLGGDFLHGGPGDDAISGGEAPLLAAARLADGTVVRTGFAEPRNPGGLLAFGADPSRPETFLLFDPADPEGAITVDGQPFLLATEPAGSDGDDAIFGGPGNDWLVGGTGRNLIPDSGGSDAVLGKFVEEEPEEEPEDGENTDGENTDGENTDGENTDGENTDNGQSDGKNTDGENTDGDETDGKTPNDPEDRSDGKAPTGPTEDEAPTEDPPDDSEDGKQTDADPTDDGDDSEADDRVVVDATDQPDGNGGPTPTGPVLVVGPENPQVQRFLMDLFAGGSGPPASLNGLLPGGVSLLTGPGALQGGQSSGEDGRNWDDFLMYLRNISNNAGTAGPGYAEARRALEEALALWAPVIDLLEQRVLSALQVAIVALPGGQQVLWWGDVLFFDPSALDMSGVGEAAPVPALIRAISEQFSRLLNRLGLLELSRAEMIEQLQLTPAAMIRGGTTLPGQLTSLPAVLPAPTPTPDPDPAPVQAAERPAEDRADDGYTVYAEDGTAESDWQVF